MPLLQGSFSEFEGSQQTTRTTTTLSYKQSTYGSEISFNKIEEKTQTSILSKPQIFDQPNKLITAGFIAVSLFVGGVFYTHPEAAAKLLFEIQKAQVDVMAYAHEKGMNLKTELEIQVYPLRIIIRNSE